MRQVYVLSLTPAAIFRLTDRESGIRQMQVVYQKWPGIGQPYPTNFSISISSKNRWRTKLGQSIYG
jgi:hypothetical protein